MCVVYYNWPAVVAIASAPTRITTATSKTTAKTTVTPTPTTKATATPKLYLKRKSVLRLTPWCQ